MPRLLLLFVSAACTTEAPSLPADAGRSSGPEGRDAVVAPNGVVGTVSRSADREVWTETVGSGPFTRVVARSGGEARTLVADADRAVLSPDGRWVAFVYAPDGLAAIGVVPFEGGAPIQLTNVGVAGRKHAPDVAPEGFVPLPADDSLAFVGDGLAWDTVAGRMSVALPPLQVSGAAPGQETR